MKLPKMNCKFGAPMGRKRTLPENPHVPRKLHLVRVRLDSRGYDSGGAYWGIGNPLYWATDTDGPNYTADVFLRATSRTEAKAKVRELIPGATFYR